jgi:hypothetical protein
MLCRARRRRPFAETITITPDATTDAGHARELNEQHTPKTRRRRSRVGENIIPQRNRHSVIPPSFHLG